MCMQSLQIKPHPDPTNWPALFDEIISILGTSADRVYFRGIQGINEDSTNLIRGFIEPIMQQQGEFSGWKRICFAIYKPNSMNLGSTESFTGEEAGDADEIPWFSNEFWPPYVLQSDFSSINGYEGVLLPGGRIMMGRFVDMIQTSDRGPFIFWDL
ncbi:hypothetical protein PHISCL_02126 [Aspergillus sclerotialis]|uniref:Uncharacterized protein n=1 Tax=Aspergillus sclerotialis TaxID=2070753 RepID=A0A3A3A1E8_9EURO|nr:hypothetical protein PHISCL_02126 [Aspergillus sclerotialis]